MKNSNKGNSFIISIIFIAIIIIILFFVCTVFIGETNSILYNIKLDMYSINKSAIISVNKGITSRSKSISYNKNEYLNYFKEMVKENYNLDDNLSNTNGIVQKVEIIDYEIYKNGKKDKYTNKYVDGTTIHSVIKVRIKPVLFENLLKDKFVFDIHEDVSMNLVKV